MVQYLNNSNGFNQWANMQNQKKPSRLGGFLWWLFLFLFAWWIMGIWFKPQNVEINQTPDVKIEQSTANTRAIESDDISMDVTVIHRFLCSVNKIISLKSDICLRMSVFQT